MKRKTIFMIATSIVLSITACTDQNSQQIESAQTASLEHGEDHFVIRNETTNEILPHIVAPNGEQKPSYLFGSTSYKWTNGYIPWRYNPAGQPSIFTTQQVIDSLVAATKRWEAVCGVKFAYQGLSSSAINISGCDGATVVSWNKQSGTQLGYTHVCYGSGTQLKEFDLALDNEAPLQISSTSLLTKYSTHEFGHALGLGHSDISSAVMYPIIYANALGTDDIVGCQNIYGPSLASSPAPTPTPSPAPSPSCGSMSATECDLFKRVNALRTKSGLASYKVSANCVAEAQYHAKEMAATGYFSYDSPNESFDSRMKRFNLGGSYYAENIAWGFTTSAGVLDVWLSSSGNKGKLLATKFKSSGVGYAVSSSGRTYWAQCYSGW